MLCCSWLKNKKCENVLSWRELRAADNDHWWLSYNKLFYLSQTHPKQSCMPEEVVLEHEGVKPAIDGDAMQDVQMHDDMPDSSGGSVTPVYVPTELNNALLRFDVEKLRESLYPHAASLGADSEQDAMPPAVGPGGVSAADDTSTTQRTTQHNTKNLKISNAHMHL